MQLDSTFHLMIPYVTFLESYFWMLKDHNTVAFPCKRSIWNKLHMLPSVDTTDFRIYSRVPILRCVIPVMCRINQSVMCTQYVVKHNLVLDGMLIY